MVTVECKGDYKDTKRFLQKLSDNNFLSKLQMYGEMGVEALRAYTPKDTGLTSESWYYEIEMGSNGLSINWLNSNVNKGSNIAILIQYGHGTGTGGYVQGRDYINPAMKSVFDNITESIISEVSNA